jgi:hypothetical protein
LEKENSYLKSLPRRKALVTSRGTRMRGTLGARVPMFGQKKAIGIMKRTKKGVPSPQYSVLTGPEFCEA